MMAQARLRNASWMSSRISQRIRSRRNQVQQRDGLLDHSAVHAQARTMLGATAGDHGGDALGPDLPTVLVVVIAPVSVDRIRALPGPSRRPRTAGMAPISGISWVMSLCWPPVSDTASGTSTPHAPSWPGSARKPPRRRPSPPGAPVRVRRGR